jgi:hypothetical protein
MATTTILRRGHEQGQTDRISARAMVARTMVAQPMPTPVPSDSSKKELRSLIWRVAVFFVAGIAVIAAFAIAWRFGAFAPSRR